jgi:general secretion pathway protein K
MKRGIALVAVLWLVAALSIMLVGLQHVVRGEVQTAGQAQNGVISSGIADAAIRLTLQGMVATKSVSEKAVRIATVTVFDSEVTVQVVPLNGLIDLNNASESLLADAYEYGGGLPKEEALRLANLTVEARERRGPDALPERLHAIEDLLRMPGMSYDAYAKIASSLTTEIAGGGRINPLAASSETLSILGRGDRIRALQLVESRLSNPESMDATTLTTQHLQMEPTSYLAISATLKSQGDVTVTRTWRVDLSTPTRGLPWRVLAVDQRVARGVISNITSNVTSN